MNLSVSMGAEDWGSLPFLKEFKQNTKRQIKDQGLSAFSVT
jgi:hypothetical protein